MTDKLLDGSPDLEKDIKEKKKLEKLNFEEVNSAKLLVANNHVLLGTPLEKIFPVLKIIGVGKGEAEKAGALLEGQENGNDHHHDEHHKHHHKKKNFPIEGDTLDQYGFGMVAYKDLMFTMFWLFGILSVLMLPAMYYYGQGSGIGTYM
jgi:hypothetical protein